MQDGDAILVMVQDGKVIHYSWNMALPHIEFERRKTMTGCDGEKGHTVYLHFATDVSSNAYLNILKLRPY
jgi:hypothetical protein